MTIVYLVAAAGTIGLALVLAVRWAAKSVRIKELEISVESLRGEVKRKELMAEFYRRLTKMRGEDAVNLLKALEEGSISADDIAARLSGKVHASGS